jgi:hypothetical protein
MPTVKASHGVSTLHGPAVTAADNQVIRQLSERRIRRNSSITVVSLPREILARIFLFLTEPRRKESLLHCATDLVAASHVCHCWRTAALLHPFLWRKIVFTPNARLTQLMLNRTRYVSIAIAADLDELGVESKGGLLFVYVIKKELHRISSIHFRLSRSNHLPLIDAMSRPAPILESLTWLGPCNSSENWLVDSVAVPFDALQAPRLLHLDLHGVRLKASYSHPFASLTSISIFSHGIVERLSYATTLSLWSNNPGLERISLFYALPNMAWTQPRMAIEGYAPPTSLLRLKQLELHDDIGNLIPCIASLILSPNVHRVLGATAEGPLAWALYVDAFLPALRLHLLKSGVLDQICVASIRSQAEQAPSYSFKLATSESEITSADAMACESQQFMDLSIDIISTTQEGRALQAGLRWETSFLRLCASSLRKLSIDSAWAARESDAAYSWAPVFANLPVLENLFLTGDAIAFGEPKHRTADEAPRQGAIVLITPRADGRSAGALPLPRLRTLTLSRVSLHNIRFRSALTECLEIRRGAAAPVLRLALELRRDRSSRVFVDEVRGLVPKVEARLFSEVAYASRLGIPRWVARSAPATNPRPVMKSLRRMVTRQFKRSRNLL